MMKKDDIEEGRYEEGWHEGFIHVRDKMKKEDMKDSSMMSDSSSEMKDDMKKRWDEI